MKLYSNYIPTGNGKTLDDIVAAYKQRKQANAEGAVVKTAASESDEGPSSGQLDPEPLHQKGESTPKPHKSEGKGDKPKAKVEGDDKEAAQKGKTKAAAGIDNFGDKKAEPFGKKKDDGKSDKEDDKEDSKKDDKKDKDVKAQAKGKTKVAEDKDEADSSGQPEWEGKKENVNCPKEEDEKACTAAVATKGRFVRFANLDDKSKTWLRSFWRNLYPAEFVEAMLSDK